MIFTDEEITIRPLMPNYKEYNKLYFWLNDPAVNCFYGSPSGISIAEIERHYGAKCRNDVDFPCIIEYDGVEIGYLQYYIATADNYNLTQEQYAILNPEDKVLYAIDLFIGSARHTSQGIGTRVLSLLIRELSKQSPGCVFCIDPCIHNARAIACYHKVGFKDLFVAPGRDAHGESLIMQFEG